VPGLAVKLLMVALITWFAGAAYTVYLNPEITFLRIAAIKQAWASRMTREYGPNRFLWRFVAFSKSRPSANACATSANLRLGAGMGLRVLTRSALEHVHLATLIMAGTGRPPDAPGRPHARNSNQLCSGGRSGSRTASP
jgi:hypothetical protein